MKLAFYHKRGKNEWFTKANVPLSPAAIDRVLQIAYHCAGLAVLTTCSHLRQEAIVFRSASRGARMPRCVAGMHKKAIVLPPHLRIAPPTFTHFLFSYMKIS
jgi:metal-dependent hydrolase (beta-lactamase superfamily II)